MTMLKGIILKDNIMRNLYLAVFIMIIAVGCVSNEEGRNIRRTSAAGAGGGALLGLALGAAVGEPGLGMAAGAASGAAAGAMYEYDQTRQDRRAKMVSESIGGAKKGETAGTAGKRHLDDFIGEWNLSIWALDAQGNRINANGKAKGVLESTEVAKIEVTDVKANGYDAVLSGVSILKYSPENGFEMENNSSVTETRKFVGEYVPENNLYQFYPSINKDGETITGVIRSNIRIELRVSGKNLITASTFSMKEGKEIKIQEYRFTK